MTQHYEISAKHASPEDCNRLLYAPLSTPLTYHETQCYTFDYEGDAEALDCFVQKVLLDPISQDSHAGGAPLHPEATFLLEYGMKGGALDLEKETILQYYRTLEAPGFTLNKLTLRKRIYVFGDNASPEPFVRDVVNPAIHTHKVIDPQAA